jgi:CRP-like cAMP-binding protein
MLLTIEKVLILKSVHLFSSIPEQQLVDIATIIDVVDYEEGDLIMKAGDLGSSMYIVAEGRLRVFSGERELGILGSRTVFGELAALDPEPRAASVEALEDCTLLKLDGETLYELMMVNKELTRGIVHVLCDYARTNLSLNPREGS